MGLEIGMVRILLNGNAKSPMSHRLWFSLSATGGVTNSPTHKLGGDFTDDAR